MAYVGWPSLCLRVTDLESSKKFYEAVGLSLISEVPGKRAILGFGAFRLALMTFLDESLINVRGSDVLATRERLRADFPNLEGEADFYSAEEYDADADGCCWTARDPDGNVVFFDTNERETGPEYVASRTADILDGAIEELGALGSPQIILDGLERLGQQVE